MGHKVKPPDDAKLVVPKHLGYIEHCELALGLFDRAIFIRASQGVRSLRHTFAGQPPKYDMRILEFFSDRLQRLGADHLTTRNYRVTLHLDPSIERDDVHLNEATQWAKHPDRRGACRRVIRAGDGIIDFVFESELDAVEFGLRY
ncbi:hypothetical protein [Brevundimonas sp. KM4]|uniref:hypothetical protein n=1 Tax=Brevundimonas sp. KM4 TaxID=1628191 RepID=UPI00061F614F|nr:hypothetical protein [Brevundimonas sp. KM4]KJV37869.1 hypothetical protein VH88_15140 [Brevundimonas sp. KM4]